MAKRRKGRKARRNPKKFKKQYHAKFKVGKRKAHPTVKKHLIQGGWADTSPYTGATYVNPFYRAMRMGMNPGHRSKLFQGPNSYTALFKRGKKASPVVKRHIAAGGWGKVVKRGRRAKQIRLNPMSAGGLIGLVKGAVGLGLGAALATKVVPTLAGRIYAPLGSGLPAVAVGLLGAGVLGRVIGRVIKSPKLAGQVQTGALVVGVGVPLVGLLVRYLPTAVTRPLGLAGLGALTPISSLIRDEALYRPDGMADYLQLSGPVPQAAFADGLSDYVNFASAPAAAAAEAMSSAVTQWTPASEGF